MRKIQACAFVTAAVLAAALTGEAMGQCYGGRCHSPAYAMQGRAIYRQAPTYQAPAVAYQAPGYAQPQAFAPAPPAAAPSGGGYAEALALLNQERALRGRPPLGWSADLAGWAASNFGGPSNPHQVLAPGAGQCQAWCGDAVTAMRQWLASPPHFAILMNATTSVGVSSDRAGGFTANAR